MADLVQKKETEVRKLRRFGYRSLLEIKEVLEGMGLYLEMTLDPGIIEEASRVSAEKTEKNLRTLIPESRERRSMELYPEPDVPLSADDWNQALKTRNGEQIARMLAPFQEQPLQLMPPIEGLEEQAKRALNGLGNSYPVWIVSVSERRKEVTDKQRAYQKAKREWERGGKKTRRPIMQYIPVISETYVHGGWHRLSFHELPKSRPFSHTQRQYTRDLHNVDWVSFVVQIRYLLKAKGKVWHRLQESFREYLGGNLACSVQLQCIRSVILDVITCEVGLIADGFLSQAEQIDPFVQLALHGNIPYGIVYTRWVGAEERDDAFIIFVA